MKRLIQIAMALSVASCASQHKNLREIVDSLPSANNVSESGPVPPPSVKATLPAPIYPKYFSKDSLTERRKDILRKIYSSHFPKKQDPSDDELLNLQKEILFRFYGSKDPSDSKVVFPRESIDKIYYTVFEQP